jgi:hypothetical protein
VALQDIQPLSAYTYESVLPRLGYVQRTDDETGATNWYNLTPDEGTGRVRFEEGAPTDPGLQYAPQRLYEKDLRSQGYVPLGPDLSGVMYAAQVAQYGEGQTFGGNPRKYIDYVFGPGSEVIQDPVHGWLVKPSDPNKLFNPTPVAFPRTGGSFLQEALPVLALPATMAFAGPLAQALGTVLGPVGGQIAASALIGGTQAELSGGDFAEGAIKAGTTAAIGQGTNALGVSSGLRDVLTQAGLPLDISQAIAGGITDTAKTALSAAATGGDVSQAILRGAATSAAGIAGQAVQRATTEPEIVRGGIEEQTPAQVAEQMGPEAYALAYPEQAPVDMTAYEGLGYTPEEVRQLQAGTYAGREQTEPQAREQLGPQFDITYPEGMPTSSSAYEGLGYTAKDIYELGEGTYAGPEQPPEQAREQLGSQYDLAYGDVYREPTDISGEVRQTAAPIAGYLLTPEQRFQQAGGYTTPAEPAAASPASTAYLARGAIGSPEITGSPVFGTEKGKRKKVWNIESLREALGV